MSTEPPAAVAGSPPPPGATRRRPPLAVLIGAAVAVVAAGILVIVLVGGGAGPLPRVNGAPPVSLADPVPYDGRSPAQLRGSEVRVLVQFSRRPLGLARNARSMGAEDQRTRINSLKREAITTRSALAARGVGLHDVVAFYRVWNGFAATIRTSDLPKLNSPGVQVRTVRRAYPATSEPVPLASNATIEQASLNGTPPVAVLDTGIDAKALNGHADPGYDAVDRDRDPKPGTDPSSKRKETSGTALAGIVAAAGERVLPIRIASLRAAGGASETVSTTDEIIAGLEHAVDPNGDQDTSDHVPVALIGVNAPYAGFSDTPEAQAVKGAAGLGTLVIAPAGNEGAAKPGSGTVGSPASAPDALAVGALAGPEPAPRTELKADGDTLGEAAVLSGKPPASGTTAGPVQDTDAAVLGASQTKIRGKVVIVRAGANPAAQAAAAAAVGASAVLLARPGDDPLPSLSAGRSAAPVVGVTGDAAEQVLKLKPGTPVSFGAPQRAPRAEETTPHVSPLTAQGPSAGGLPKPDLAAASSALTVNGVAGGTAIAAAHVAAVAAKYARAHPEFSPQQLRAALIAAADPQSLAPDRAGAGVVREPTSGITADPPTQESGALDPITVDLNATSSTPLQLRATGGATAQPQTLTVTPGAPAAVTVRLPKPGTTTGRLEALNAGKVVASVPWLIHPDEVEPIKVGELKVDRNGRRVRFTLGAFQRGAQTEVQVAEKLILDLVDSKGRIKRTLTFPGGARELMPAEYAYTLPSSQAGTFRVRAWAPNQSQPTVRTSK